MDLRVLPLVQVTGRLWRPVPLQPSQPLVIVLHLIRLLLDLLALAIDEVGEGTQGPMNPRACGRRIIGDVKTRAHKICALLLAVAMMPGVFELLENAAHVALEGHLAHAAAAGDQHDPTGPEHGCTPIFHACGCHASLAFVGGTTPAAAGLSAADLAGGLDPETLLAGFWPSIDRPPQA